MKILITGANGFLGSHLIEKLSPKYRVCGIVRNESAFHSENLFSCDITNSEALNKVLEKTKPNIIIHTAACSALGYCDQNPEDSYNINVGSTKILVDWAKDNQAALIYTSTDQVFDGKKSWYSEEDIPHPVSVYGEQKMEAEKEILQHSENLVLRLPLLFGIGKGNRKGTMPHFIEQVKSGKKLTLFTNEYRTPLSANEVVRAMEFSIENKLKGIYHLAGNERVNRYELGLLFAQTFNLSKDSLHPTTRAEVGMSDRPEDVSMKNKKLKKVGFYPITLNEMLNKISKNDLL